MKSKIFKSALAAVLICSSVALCACDNGKKTDVPVYTSLSSLVKEINETGKESKLLISGIRTWGDRRSDYVLTPFDEKIEDHYFQTLFIVPMNYIADHYETIKELDAVKKMTKEQKSAVDTLKSDVNNMKNEFEDTLKNFTRLNSFTNTQVIYDDELQNFRFQATELIGATYKVALSLASVEDVFFRTYSGMVNKEELTEKDSVMLRDYLSLFIAQDFYTLACMNAKSVHLENKVQVIYDVFDEDPDRKEDDISKAPLGIYAKDFLKEVYCIKNLASLSASSGTTGGEAAYNSKVSDLLEANAILKNDREILLNATSKFSYYDYLKSYTGELPLSSETMSASKGYEDVYARTIENYFNVTLKKHIKYLASILQENVNP